MSSFDQLTIGLLEFSAPVNFDYDKHQWCSRPTNSLTIPVLLTQGSAFFRLLGFLELNWTILEISANLMGKSYDPPPPDPSTTLGCPKRLRIRRFKVGFSKFSGGGPPDLPHIK